MPNVLRSDIVVVGSGIAGLYFSYHAAQYASVSIITKKELAESNSNYAQGGVAAVLDPLDDFAAHVEDTLNAGAYHNDVKIVEKVVKNAPKHIHKLIDLGVGFNRTNGTLDLTQEGGHSTSRIVHAHDTTGREVERALVYTARHHENISIYESHYGVEILTNSSGQAIGVAALNRETNQIEHHFAKVVVLATGGAGQVYSVTSNPRIATGDGIAMASRAGAKVSDMEFFQFHPTTLRAPKAPNFLLSEALRGEGAHLRNHRGRRFMPTYDKRAELAPRDIVSRAVFEQLQTGPVTLDMTHLPGTKVKARFPYIYEQLWWYGLKLDQDRIPITPAAHYLCGGVTTDGHGRSSVENLYAIGEVANTGLHGANRLASNSILECLVLADSASRSIRQRLKRISSPRTTSAEYSTPRLRPNTPSTVYRLRSTIRRTMWKSVGIVRSTKTLEAAIRTLSKAEQELATIQRGGTTVYIEETRNLANCGYHIAHQALARPRSLGAHYRTD